MFKVIKNMHQFQEKLLKLLSKRLLINYKTGLRNVGRIIGTENPQNVKHHLDQLEKKGKISINKKTGEVILLQPIKHRIDKIFDLPVVGIASCNPSGIFADENIEEYLKISQKAVGEKSPKSLFVVRAVGDSMNQAENIRGGTIENGDYVIINSSKAPRNGDYVLSIIDESANIKRFYKDRANKEIRLVSESTISFPPIILNEDDLEDKNYFINGTVERVVKI